MAYCGIVPHKKLDITWHDTILRHLFAHYYIGFILMLSLYVVVPYKNWFTCVIQRHNVTFLSLLSHCFIVIYYIRILTVALL